MIGFFDNLRSGLRAFGTYPVLSLVAVLTLGVGIGLSTTIFSIVNGALFKGLPFEDPNRVVSLITTRPEKNTEDDRIAVQDLVLWQARQRVFDALGPFDTESVNLSSDASRPERISAARLSVGAFEVLRVKPILGRGLQSGDDRPGAQPVVLLGYQVWRDRFHGASDVLGKTIKTNGDDRVVVGVMPERFGFPNLEQLWMPLPINPDERPRGKGPHFQVIGRLKPEVSLAQAQTQARLIASQLEHEFPNTNQGLSADVWPFTRSALGPEVFSFLYTALGAGIGVLVIACVNVSNLLVARASLRWREVAVRMALGAGRGHVIRQHLAEVLLLAILGGGIGIAISIAGMRWFNAALAVDPPPFWMKFDLDAHVLLFVAALVVTSSLLAGILPSLHASRVSAVTVLRDDSRSSTGARLGRFSGVLVVIELAVSCGLLIAAGLMTKSLVQLRTIRMPFAVEGVLTMRVDLPNRQYPDAARVRFYDQLLARLWTLPGATATLSDSLPAEGTGNDSLQIDGRSYARDSDYPLARRAKIGPKYFETFQVPLVRGREFLPSDTSQSARVAVVNETFARTNFPGEDSIGRRVRSGGADSKEPWFTIVGVVPDLLMEGIGNNESGSGYYVPIVQLDAGGSLRIVVRSRNDAATTSALVRSALGSIDRDLPMADVMTLPQIILRQTWFYGVFGTLFLVFGCSGLCLAAAGLYGVMSFAVTQRTREMGVRAALGAPRAQLVLLVMRRCLIQLAIGLVAGIGLGLAASQPLQILLYRVNPHDPFVTAIVVVTLALTSVAASLIPAWRVTRIDPTVALAAE